MFIDGSDVGVGGQNLNGFLRLIDGSILMTFKDSFSLSAVGTVDDSDIVQFFPTTTGSSMAGSFSLYFDGPDVDLTTSGEDIDAIGLAPDGRLVISTVGSFDVPGVSGKDEDLLVFHDTCVGSTTSGSFDLYFDGSDVGLTDSGEDVSGTWIDTATGEIHLTTQGSFSETGASGDQSDISTCDPGTLGRARLVRLVPSGMVPPMALAAKNWTGLASRNRCANHPKRTRPRALPLDVAGLL